MGNGATQQHSPRMSYIRCVESLASETAVLMEIENLGEQLLDACLSDIEQAEWIITHHNDKNILNWQDLKCRNSILHILVYQNLHIPVDLLLNSGANPNIANKVWNSLYFNLIYLRMVKHLCIG